MAKKARIAASPFEFKFGEFPSFGLGEFPRLDGHARQLAFYPLEAWLRWQAGMLDAMAPATASWIARRREGTKATLKTLEELAECEEVGDAVQLQREWLEAEIKRVQSDLEALAEQSFRWSRETAKAGQSAVDVIEEAGQQAKASSSREAA